jgi:uncharacterized protein RhaS with RHS repeats
MRARYYDPGTGRFASEDPGRNGANWYAYVESDPTNAGDYTGDALEPLPPMPEFSQRPNLDPDPEQEMEQFVKFLESVDPMTSDN